MTRKDIVEGLHVYVSKTKPNKRYKCQMHFGAHKGESANELPNKFLQTVSKSTLNFKIVYNILLNLIM